MSVVAAKPNCCLLLVSGQVLGIPYECLSVSDPDAACQAFMKANFAPTHVHDYLHEQLPEPGSFGLHHWFQVGTPCPPFSKMRVKRHAPGSCQSHKDYDTMFQVVTWLQEREPQAGAFEQVKGFTMTEDSRDPTTPLQRLGAWSCHFMTRRHTTTLIPRLLEPKIIHQLICSQSSQSKAYGQRVALVFGGQGESGREGSFACIAYTHRPCYTPVLKKKP